MTILQYVIFQIGLIVINYLRPTTTKYVRQIRQHYATLNKNQQSINGWLGIVFFCFTLGLMNLTWFIINDEPLQPYKEWRKGDTLTYLKALHILIFLLLLLVCNMSSLYSSH
jgi:hypothetical protein